MSEKEDFRARPEQVVPVLATAGLSFLLAQFLLQKGFQPFDTLPFSDEGFGPFLNAGYLVISMIVAAFALYFLLRFRKNIFRAMVLGSFLTSVLIVTFFYLSVFFDMPEASLGPFLISMALTVVATLAVFKLGKVPEAVTLVVLGSSLGALLGVAMPTTSAITILLALSLYDIYAVHKGPVGKMVGSVVSKELKPLLLYFKGVHIGLGDLVFYSFLIAHTTFYLGPLPALASIVGVSVGSFISFKLLEVEKMIPGLPISLTLGLILAFLIKAL